MKTTVKLSGINSLEQLYDFAPLIKKGIISMPNATRIARQIGSTPYKVRQALNGNIPKKTRTRSKYLDQYYDSILNFLSAEEHKHREFEYIQHLYEFCVEKLNISCCYTTFRTYIFSKDKLKKNFKKSSESFTERFETEAGKQAQFDFKENIKIVFTNQEVQKVHFATMTLGYSRYTIRIVLLEKTIDTILRTWAMMFKILGGVPSELVIDNIPGLVNVVSKKGVVHSKAIQFAKDYGFKLVVCKPRRPETKGKVETKNKYIGRIKNYNGDYTDLHDIVVKNNNITLTENHKVHQGTSKIPALIFPFERTKLNELPRKSISDQYYNYFHKNAKVTKDCLFSYNNKKYSVPKQYILKTVSIHVYYEYIHVYYNNNLVTWHKISDKKLNIDPKHDLKYQKNNSDKSTQTAVAQIEQHLNEMNEFERINYDNIPRNNK